MSRRYRKSRRDPGLFEIATTSDCKVSAAMAAVCVLAATVIIPAMFGSSRVLGGLVPAFVPLASGVRHFTPNFAPLRKVPPAPARV